MTYIYIMSRPFENMPRSLKDGDSADLQSITFPDGTTQDTAFTGGGGGGTTCAFSAWVSGSGGNSSTTGVFPANAERYDLGGNYNTSNYTFTAPVAGIYNFKYGVYSNETGSSTHSRIALLVNGTEVQFRGAGYPPYNWGNQVSMDVELAANDTVKWSAVSPYNIYYLETTNSNHTIFSGHLVKETT